VAPGGGGGEGVVNLMGLSAGRWSQRQMRLSWRSRAKRDSEYVGKIYWSFTHINQQLCGLQRYQNLYIIHHGKKMYGHVSKK
jgi:hypothetical protein